MTSMTSVTWPTARSTSTRVTLFTVTGTPVVVLLLNPSDRTSTRYVPVATVEKLYAPASLDSPLRDTPVSSWVMLTCAPGITAPVLSATLPTMLP